MGIEEYLKAIDWDQFVPKEEWKSDKQTKEFILKYRSIIETLNATNPDSNIHLFYAGPVPPMIHIASTYNPRMDNPFFLYYFKADPNRIRGKYTYICNILELMEKDLLF